jgi:hypothetical protein
MDEDSTSQKSDHAQGDTAPEVRLVVRGDPNRDPNRLSWPPTRTDLLTLVFVIAFGYCLIQNRGPAITIPVLVAALFAGISPRMKGPFGWRSGGGASLGGEFGDPFEDSKQAVGATRPAAAAEAAAVEPAKLDPPPRTESGEG